MSSTYNAITNLQEIEMDSLIVNLATIDTALIDNLDCNVGTIDTLTSTTATITSANIPTLTNTTLTNTTTNTTNLNTNNIQSNPLSSNVSLYTNGTGTLLLGNNSNTNAITIFQSVNLNADKNLTLNGTGRIITPNLRVSSLTPNKIVLTNGSYDLVSSSYTDTDFAILSANNIYSGTNTFNNTILGNTITGTSVGSAISLYGSTTSTIGLGNLSGGTFTINPNTQMNGNLTLASGKNLTLQPTGELIVETIRGYAFANTINMYLAQLGAINFGNTSSTNPLTINNNTILASGKTLTLNNTTASKILLTNGSKNVVSSSYNETDLAILSNNNAFTNAQNSFNKVALNTTSNQPDTDLEIWGTNPKITLYSASAGGVYIDFVRGNRSFGADGSYDFRVQNVSGYFSIINGFNGVNTEVIALRDDIDIKGNVNISANKNLILTAGTGKITTPAILVSGLTGSKMVLTDTNKNLVSSSYTDTDFVLKSGSSMTGTLNVNNIQGTTTSSAITLYTNSSVSSPTITLGNASGGVFTINPNTTLNGTLSVNTISALSTIATGSLFGNIVGGTCNIGTSLTGSMNIGTSMRNGILTIGSSSFDPALNTGNAVINLPVYFNQDLNIAFGKDIVMASTGLIKSETLTGLAYNLTLNLGENGDSGGITCNRTMTFDINKNLTMNSTGIISVNTLRATGTTISPTIYTNITDPASTITIGNSANAGVVVNSDLFVNSTKSLGCNNLYSRGSSDLNINTFSSVGYFINLQQDTKLATGKNLTLSTTGKIICDTIEGTAPADNIVLFSTTTGTTTLGNTGGADLTINTSVVLPANKTITLNAVGGRVICNTLDGASATITGLLFNNLTTASINIGSGITTGDVNIARFATSGSVNILNTASTSTGVLTIGSKFRQQRNIGGTLYSSFWNVATGSANNIFQSSVLSASAMPPIYANAQVDDWAVWESNAEGEACFIAQNGNTTIICNPGDNFAFHWQDEDSMGSASGFKFAVDGVMSTSSDRRLKRDINPIPVGSDLLDKLSLIQYVNYKKKAPTEEKYYKNGELRNKYQKIRKGLIAQDVKQIFPEVVEKDGEYLMMKYAEVGIYFNMGVQELIKQNKQRTQENINLQAQIDSQKLQIDDLTSRLARLEQILLNP